MIIPSPVILAMTAPSSVRRGLMLSIGGRLSVTTWGLLFYDVGAGKAFAVVGIANALLEQAVPVRMTNFPVILNRLPGCIGGQSNIYRQYGCLRSSLKRTCFIQKQKFPHQKRRHNRSNCTGNCKQCKGVKSSRQIGDLILIILNRLARCNINANNVK